MNSFWAPTGIDTSCPFVLLYPQYATSGCPSPKRTHSSTGVTVFCFGFAVFSMTQVIDWPRPTLTSTDGPFAVATTVSPFRQTVSIV